jgi:ribonucleoside-diphosphate reductase alpha chain
VEPQTEKVAELFAGIHIPTQDDWRELKASIQAHGIYNQNLQAVPPTGSISYINNSTSSIHPIASKIEIRKEGKIGRVYYPAPFMTNDNLEYYQTRTRSATRRSSTPTPPPPSTSTRACR